MIRGTRLIKEEQIAIEASRRKTRSRYEVLLSQCMGVSLISARHPPQAAKVLAVLHHQWSVKSSSCVYSEDQAGRSPPRAQLSPPSCISISHVLLLSSSMSMLSRVLGTSSLLHLLSMLRLHDDTRFALACVPPHTHTRPNLPLCFRCERSLNTS